jgi:hypothetical protein
MEALSIKASKDRCQRDRSEIDGYNTTPHEGRLDRPGDRKAETNAQQEWRYGSTIQHGHSLAAARGESGRSGMRSDYHAAGWAAMVLSPVLSRKSFGGLSRLVYSSK